LIRLYHSYGVTSNDLGSSGTSRICRRKLTADHGPLTTSKLKLELIVFLVCAEPEPVVMTVPLESKDAVAGTEFSSEDRAFASEA
jgi:hypothetical protein